MAYNAPSITTSGATWANLQTDGLSGVLELLISAQAATVAPTSAPTLSETGSGGTLPTATYYVVSTESNGIGETVAGPQASQAITLGQKLVITPPSLQSGNTARNYYVGTTSGGPYLLASSGQTASATTISATLPTNSYAVAPPTINTTGFTYTDANGNVENIPLAQLRGAKYGNIEQTYRYGTQVVRNFLSGNPTPWQGTMVKFRHAHTVIASLNQLMTDIGTLLDANAGTLKIEQLPIGQELTYRGWP
jgi:hypothetical protein